MFGIGEAEEILCKRCAKRRSERKEIITEIAETEAKYGRDLRIVIEEFYRPMLVAGLLTSDQLAAIFLNADELIQVNARFCEVLRDAIDIAYDSGDEDLANVHVGKLFLESLSMLRAFESYCTRQVGFEFYKKEKAKCKTLNSRNKKSENCNQVATKSKNCLLFVIVIVVTYNASTINMVAVFQMVLQRQKNGILKG